jgi:Tol biopolymer transport system component
MIRQLFVFTSLSLFAVGAFAQTLEPELFAPGTISGPVADAAPAFSPDGQTVYFHRSGASMHGTILVSRLHSGVWSRPEVAVFSGQWQDIEAAMAPDGSYLIFSSNRPAKAGGKVLNGTWNGQHYPGGGGNLWRVDRQGDGWGEPWRLPVLINSDSSVFSPAVTADGSLYFMRPVGDTGRFHIYRSAYQNGTYQAPVAVPFRAADTVSDVDPAVAADESFIVYSSRRLPAKTMELFIVFRKGRIWSEPQPLGAEVTRGLPCIEARLSPDGKKLFFSSGWTPKPADFGEPGSAKWALEHSEWETGQMNIWSVPLVKWMQ